MKLPDQFACDICRAVKGPTNHWRVLAIDNGMLCVAPWSAVGEFDEDQSKHACGRSCAQKLFERYLETGSLEESKKPVGESA